MDYQPLQIGAMNLWLWTINSSDESVTMDVSQTHEAIRQSVQENIDHNVECIKQKMLGRGGRIVQSFS